MTTKICLILGGTGGLGAASAYDFAKDYTIIAGRNRSKVDAIVSKTTSSGGKAAFHSADITDPTSVVSLHKTALRHLRPHRCRSQRWGDPHTIRKAGRVRRQRFRSRHDG